MFQLEVVHAGILDMDILKKIGIDEEVVGDDIVVYILVCRTIAGSAPLRAPVWVHGAGKPSVKATLSPMTIDYDFKRMSYEAQVRFWDSYDINLDRYVLEAPRGAEIVAGMMISNVPPDAEPGQSGE
jgi:hypothetical protein